METCWAWGSPRRAVYWRGRADRLASEYRSIRGRYDLGRRVGDLSTVLDALKHQTAILAIGCQSNLYVRVADVFKILMNQPAVGYPSEYKELIVKRSNDSITQPVISLKLVNQNKLLKSILASKLPCVHI